VYDESLWLELFEGAFSDDAALAEKAARLWQYLLTQIESGPEGVTHARDCLERAIRLTFPFTEMYKECRDRFEASLTANQTLSNRR
jgi:hypothetical protein